MFNRNIHAVNPGYYIVKKKDIRYDNIDSIDVKTITVM